MKVQDSVSDPDRPPAAMHIKKAIAVPQQGNLNSHPIKSANERETTYFPIGGGQGNNEGARIKPAYSDTLLSP